MSDLREPNYYEIALTSRQAFSAFVLLLVCVLVSFFAGLWVGRSAEGGPVAGEARVQVARSAEGEPRLEELKFFGEQTEPAVEAEEPKPVAEAKKEPPSIPAPEPTQESTPKPTLLDQLAGAGSTSQTGNERRQAGKRRSPDPPVAVKKEAVKPSLPVPSGDEIIIQVFSSADAKQASRVLERLKADGYGAYVEPIQEKGKKLFRVRIGPFESKEAAEPVAATIRRKHRLDTWITRAGE